MNLTLLSIKINNTKNFLQIPQANQNDVIVTQAQQVHQQATSQNQLTRIISQQPMQVQVLNDSAAQVIKYEIIQHEPRNSIE